MFEADAYAGTFRFASSIRAEVTDSALLEVMRELKEITASGLTEEELAFIRSAIGQRDALRYETALQKALFISRIQQYNLPAQYVRQQSRLLQRITREELNRIGQQYIRPEQTNIVLVGDKSKIYDKVRKLGYEIVELDVEGAPVKDF
jgi:zinc protease